MATIDQVKKHYDKLTAQERFALLIAAQGRDDDPEIDALLASAPRKVWSYPNIHGLHDGFMFAGMWYMLEQLGYMASLFTMRDMAEGEGRDKTLTIPHDGQEYTASLDDIFEKIAKRALANCAAWVRLCQEYKIDPETPLKNFPHYDMMQLGLLMIEGAAAMMGEGSGPEEADITKAFDGMREVIAHYTKGWE